MAVFGNYLAIKASTVSDGTINCSTNPDYPTSTGGANIYVTNAGKIGGASGVSVSVGNYLICKTATSPTGDHATVGGNWDIYQPTTDVTDVNISGGTLTNVKLGSLTDNGFVKSSSGTGALFVDTKSYLPYSVTAMSDGTYVMGLGAAVTGTITITSGVITNLTQAA